MELILEAFGYIDQFTHLRNPQDTKRRIKEVVKEFEEIPGDITQSYHMYTCYDKDMKLVIQFSVNINDYAELVDEIDCY